LADLAWFHPAGHEMTTEDWHDGELRSFGLFVDDRTEGAAALRGTRRPERFLLIFTAALEPITFQLPSRRWGMPWIGLLDTNDDDPEAVSAMVWGPRARIERPPLSLLVLRCPGSTS
jgi:glycogen operon protein